MLVCWVRRHCRGTATCCSLFSAGWGHRGSLVLSTANYGCALSWRTAVQRTGDIPPCKVSGDQQAGRETMNASSPGLQHPAPGGLDSSDTRLRACIAQTYYSLTLADRKRDAMHNARLQKLTSRHACRCTSRSAALRVLVVLQARDTERDTGGAEAATAAQTPQTCQS